MRKKPRIFPSDLTPRERRVYGGVTLFFVLAFVAVLWPAYVPYSGIRPLVLGMPLSLFYLVAVLLLCFVVLLGVFLWEGRRGEGDGRDEGRRG